MKSPFPILLALFIICLAGGLIWSANHYHSKYETEKTRADKAVELVKLQQTTIENMQVRQRDVAALDEKYTKELADAKSTINQLKRDVDSGRKRLRISASCQAAAAPSLVNAGTCELDTNARRTYFRLREQLITTDKQVRGLQEYVREQCLR